MKTSKKEIEALAQTVVQMKKEIEQAKESLQTSSTEEAMAWVRELCISIAQYQVDFPYQGNRPRSGLLFQAGNYFFPTILNLLTQVQEYHRNRRKDEEVRYLLNRSLVQAEEKLNMMCAVEV